MRSRATRRKSRIERAGWTLIEVLVATGIFMLLLLISYMPFRLTQMAMAQTSSHNEMLHRTRMQMQRLMHDLRSGTNVTPSNVVNTTNLYYATIDFDYKDGDNVSRHVQYALQGQALVRTDVVNGVTQTQAVIPGGVAEFWVQPQQTIGTSTTLSANPVALPSLPVQQKWTPPSSGLVNKATTDPFDCGVVWVYARVSTRPDDTNVATGRRRDNDLMHQVEQLPTSYVEFGSAVLLRNP